ncbi:MAG: aspartate kinase [Candidatus Cloacimonetes bacterium]|nr:aspartate kinase [Candidatus Cloacimonadota bacterium]
MKIIVLKFGGNSLRTSELRSKVTDIIADRIQAGYSPVVVVSALGRAGEPYATDSLLDILPECSTDRHRSLISSCGEIISATLLAEELNYKNFRAIALTGWQAGILTEDAFAQSKVINIDISAVMAELKENHIPVICGFQGISASGEITTLGRGGSDTSAALLARALNASQLELFKDVDGIFTADPYKVKNARIISELDYQEIAELSGNGARIVHNPAIRQLADQKIPLLLGKTWTGKHGTCIQPCQHNRHITAVTSKSGLARLTLRIKQNMQLSAVFTAFAEAVISIDFITVNHDMVSFVFNEDKTELANSLLKRLFIYGEILSGFCKITVIGSGMTGQPGVMAKLCTSLEAVNIKILMATDSYSTISCLIGQAEEVKALNTIHNAFNLQEG